MKNNIVKTLKEYVNVQCKNHNIIEKQAVNKLTNTVCSNYLSGNYDFSKAVEYKNFINWKKKRLFAYIPDVFSTEFFLSKYIAKIIKDKANLNLPSLDTVAENILKSISKISDSENFTIITTDFKNHFNSVSQSYMYESYLKNLNFTQEEQKLLKEYVLAIPYCIAGLTPSQHIAGEISAHLFNEKLKQNLQEYNLIDCHNYGDDLYAIFNTNVDEQNIINVINKTTNQVFYDENISVKHKNKVKVYTSNQKFSIISSNNLPAKFNFVSYDISVFKKGNLLDFKLDLAPLFKTLTKDKLKQIILKYSNDAETLRKKLLIYSRRLIYDKKSVYHKNFKTVSFSYSQNRRLLRKYISKVSNDTINFYNSAIIDCFKELNLPIPYYLKDSNPLSGYSLYANLIKDRTHYLNSKK